MARLKQQRHGNTSLAKAFAAGRGRGRGRGGRASGASTRQRTQSALGSWKKGQGGGKSVYTSLTGEKLTGAAAMLKSRQDRHFRQQGQTARAHMQKEILAEQQRRLHGGVFGVAPSAKSVERSSGEKSSALATGVSSLPADSASSTLCSTLPTRLAVVAVDTALPVDDCVLVSSSTNSQNGCSTNADRGMSTAPLLPPQSSSSLADTGHSLLSQEFEAEALLLAQHAKRQTRMAAAAAADPDLCEAKALRRAIKRKFAECDLADATLAAAAAAAATAVNATAAAAPTMMTTASGIATTTTTTTSTDASAAATTSSSSSSLSVSSSSPHSLSHWHVPPSVCDIYAARVSADKMMFC